MPDPDGHTPLLFGLRIPASGPTAAWNEAFESGNPSPRKSGRRLYIMGGMTREATQESGGWKSPALMENV